MVSLRTLKLFVFFQNTVALENGEFVKEEIMPYVEIEQIKLGLGLQVRTSSDDHIHFFL